MSKKYEKSIATKNHIIVIFDNNSVVVYNKANVVKHELQKIAEANNFEYDKKWTTRQLGNKLIKEFGDDKNTFATEDFCVYKEESGSIVCGTKHPESAKEGLREIANEKGIPFEDSWNTQTFGRKMYEALINLPAQSNTEQEDDNFDYQKWWKEISCENTRRVLFEGIYGEIGVEYDEIKTLVKVDELSENMIEGFKKITDFGISLDRGEAIKNLDFLRAFAPRLEKLIFEKVEVEEGFRIKFEFPKLRFVELFKTNLVSLQELQTLNNVKVLKLIDNYKMDDLKGLETFTNLLYLEISDISIEKLDGVEGMKNLKHLHLSTLDKLADISNLTTLKTMEILEFENCKKITRAQIDELREQLPNCYYIEIDYGYSEMFEGYGGNHNDWWENMDWTRRTLVLENLGYEDADDLVSEDEAPKDIVKRIQQCQEFTIEEVDDIDLWFLTPFYALKV